MHAFAKYAGLTALLATVVALSFAAGVNRTVARSAYVQSMAIQEELKCFDTRDIECLRANWTMRASMVAASAKSALESPLPASMSAELQAYVVWAGRQPGVQLGGR